MPKTTQQGQEVTEGLVMEAEKAILRILNQLEEDTGGEVEAVDVDTRPLSFGVAIFLKGPSHV